MKELRGITKENIPEHLILGDREDTKIVVDLKNEWGYPRYPFFRHVGNGLFAVVPRKRYIRTTCRECGFVGTKHGVTNNVEYITVMPDPGWELAHLYCSNCDKTYFVGNEPCPECDGWKEPEPTRIEPQEDEEPIPYCDCPDEEE